MIRVRTVVVSDPLARANVLEALAGRGAPAGITSCTADGPAIRVTFDAAITAPELIDALIEIELSFVAERSPAFADRALAAAAASRGLDEPALDAQRIIETYLA